MGGVGQTTGYAARLFQPGCLHGQAAFHQSGEGRIGWTDDIEPDGCNFFQLADGAAEVARCLFADTGVICVRPAKTGEVKLTGDVCRHGRWPVTRQHLRECRGFWHHVENRLIEARFMGQHMPQGSAAVVVKHR